MFNDGGVLPMRGHGRSPRAPAPTLQQLGLFGPRAGSESFQLGGDYSEEQELRRRPPPEGVHRPPGREEVGAIMGWGPVGSFCSTEEGGSPRDGVVEGLQSTKGQ